MQQHREFDESVHEQPSLLYEGYQGNQESAPTHFKTPSAQLFSETPASKVYPQPRENQNLFRFGMATLAMLTLVVLVVLCLIVVGGTGGWVSFIIAGCILLGIAIAALAGRQ
jgi:hypothetical protein